MLKWRGAGVRRASRIGRLVLRIGAAVVRKHVGAPLEGRELATRVEKKP